MLNEQHQEDKHWLISALLHLESHAAQDQDFHGDRDYEARAIRFQSAVVRDGKYRVVFLGAFNVGKSTAINAFLGGGYLPMDIEECTSRLTYIQRGDALRLHLDLDAPASRHEIEALERSLEGLDVAVDTSASRHIAIQCQGEAPEVMRRALEPLSTVAADEEYPHLASLREKIDALTLFVPNESLEQDIVFIDTPGVHSMSETRQKITYGVIEHCHLVIAFVDSALVGNIHDLNFIKRIITCRGRRVFFVLNKADKLESHEIDPRGAHGPAAQLLETFKQHGIADNADLFFLSGYRALCAQDLDNCRLDLNRALDDNKLLIPTTVLERILNSSSPPKDLAAYLMGQSRFPHLKERLLDYLLNENRANAVFRLADRFVYERAQDYLISIRNALTLARDPSRFDELRANRDVLQRRIDEMRTASNQTIEAYRATARGNSEQSGYVAVMRDRFSERSIENHVVAPMLEWLRAGRHLKDALQQQFKPLSAQLEHQVDEYVSQVWAHMTQVMEENESRTLDEMSRHIGAARELRAHITEPEHMLQASVVGSMSGEYAAFGAGGAVVGAMTGAAVGSVAPVIGTAIGAGIGGVIGAVVGFLARLAWSEERWIRKLTPVIRENASTMILGKDEGDEETEAISIVEACTRYLEQRAAVFETAIRGEMEHALDIVQREYDDLLVREQEIRAEQEAVIARLEPKAAKLEEIRDRAQSLLDHS